ICCGLVSLIPSLLLLYAVLRSSIHANCRIMMCLWILAQLLVYATVAWLSISNILLDEPHLKQDFDADGNDAFILRWYVLVWLMTTCFELGISLERGFSIHNPSRYHSSSASYFLILLYVIFALARGCYLVHKRPKRFWELFSNIIDIGSCSIRETYSIARAMMPIYFMSTSIKVAKFCILCRISSHVQIVIIVVNWIYFIHILPVTINQLIYISLSEVCCGIMSSMFLIHHVRLRSKLDRLLCRSSQVMPMNVDPYKNT
ncbi:hypothetical protein PRIPAC_97524, partial [Pristionchus pacificus]|uniref:Uncharacterized protein n=1 Tax=Pristionchus pacificus TaxID=54126 RepID=A0A2A6D2X0_PRIPA